MLFLSVTEQLFSDLTVLLFYYFLENVALLQVAYTVR